MYIHGATVQVVSSQIRDNQASGVRAILSKSYPRPPWIAVQCDSMHLRSTLCPVRYRDLLLAIGSMYVTIEAQMTLASSKAPLG